jgi:hypothetical protein
MIQAVKQAASVRNQVLEGFESLIPIFSDVELFLGTFPGDTNIKNMSVELTVTTLTAIEQAIGFFTSNERKSFVATSILPRQARSVCKELTGYNRHVKF